MAKRRGIMNFFLCPDSFVGLLPLQVLISNALTRHTQVLGRASSIALSLWLEGRRV